VVVNKTFFTFLPFGISKAIRGVVNLRLPAHIAQNHRRRLSPKNHIRGKCVHNKTAASDNYAAVQTNKKAGMKPAFSYSVCCVVISTSR
jgi:hypothetical protein